MSKKRIIRTARGLQLDMELLKASQPLAKPIITGKGKEKPVRTEPKNISFRPKTASRVNATTPSKRPNRATVIVEPAQAIVAKTKPVVHSAENKKAIPPVFVVTAKPTEIKPTPIVPSEKIAEIIEDAQKQNPKKIKE